MKRFARFWWDFVVGDDWRVAAGIVLALGLTAVLAATTVPAGTSLPRRTECRGSASRYRRLRRGRWGAQRSSPRASTPKLRLRRLPAGLPGPRSAHAPRPRAGAAALPRPP